MTPQVSTFKFFRPRLRVQRRRVQTLPQQAAAVENLERRLVLSPVYVGSGDELDLVGRDDWGHWWVTTPGEESHIFASWNPLADWQHVRSGDFDGDSFTDIVGWDPASGLWWVSLSDPVGSTTLIAGGWSNATTWSDVAVMDLDNAGGANDLVGRDQWGNWWGAIANGDGTFRNAHLTTWSNSVAWRDVLILDLNRDFKQDIVGRASDGSWWAAVNLGDGTFRNIYLATWNEAAGWQDAIVLHDYGEVADYRDAIVARTSWGAWWILDARADGSIESRFLAAWDESLGWHEVVAANLARDAGLPPGNVGRGDEIVGRTANGDWYALGPTTLETTLVGHWNEAADWRDVEVVRVSRPGDYPDTFHDWLVGRTAGGGWWKSRLTEVDSTGQIPPTLINERIASWNEAAGWSDVFAAGRLGGVPAEVAITARAPTATLTIFAHRDGASATVTDLDPPPTDPLDASRVSIRYIIPSLNYDVTLVLTMPSALSQRIVFDGRSGGDAFVSDTRYVGRAYGRGGDDLLDALNGHPDDELWGGDGFDTLHGDPGDMVFQ